MEWNALFSIGRVLAAVLGLFKRTERDAERRMWLRELRSLLFAQYEAAFLVGAASLRRSAAATRGEEELVAANLGLVDSWRRCEEGWTEGLPRYRELTNLLGPECDQPAQRLGVSRHHVGRRIGTVPGSIPAPDASETINELVHALMDWVVAIDKRLGHMTGMRTFATDLAASEAKMKKQK